MDFKFFNKDGGYTYLNVDSGTYKEESEQLIAQGFVEQSLIITADSAEEAETIYKSEHQGFFKKLNMLLGPFITPGYHRSK
ncbi:hypothetical protein MD535_25050 [Vibrio sp. ZSDZ65]|uniref:Uncharacterized protein n=1 Tax=Vibrio qingdaonensis TaxID=2829491 RepID=A0A9X3CVE3_9VIBR|nr:hypothetical protein [Vibrio qingdaonensis]MCW8349254.1 hypothetical protein [Vibrio qingdaonensis]